MRVAVYDIDTGRIVRIVTCAADTVLEQVMAGEGWVETDIGGCASHYIVDGEVVERPGFAWAMDTYISVADDLELTGIPSGAIMLLDGERAVIDDQDVTISFDAEGEYRLVMIPPFPFRDVDMLVTVGG